MNTHDPIQRRYVSDAVFIHELRRMLNDEGRKSVTFTVRGFSMRPFVEHERDKVVLAPPHPPQIGQVVLAEFIPKRCALHRIIAIEGDTITMQGDGNRLSQVETFTTDKIIGTAIAFIRKGKYVGTDSKLWLRYSAFWMRCRRMRRALLLVYRIAHRLTTKPRSRKTDTPSSLQTDDNIKYKRYEDKRRI